MEKNTNNFNKLCKSCTGVFGMDITDMTDMFEYDFRIDEFHLETVYKMLEDISNKNEEIINFFIKLSSFRKWMLLRKMLKEGVDPVLADCFTE